MRHLFLLISVLIWGSMQAQVDFTFQSKNEKHQELDEIFRSYEVFEGDWGVLNNLLSALQPQGSKLTLRFGTDEIFPMEIYRRKVFTDDAILYVSTDKGIQQIQAPASLSYGGRLVRDSKAGVSLTVNDDFASGMIALKSQSIHWEPLYRYVPGAPKNLVVKYSNLDIIPGKEGKCGADDLAENKAYMARMAREKQTSGAARVPNACYEIQFAMAADWSMWQKYGGSAGVLGQISGILSDCQANYDDEFTHQLVLVISGTFFSNCSTCDPWSTSTDAGTLLNSFTGWGNGPGFPNITYDIGELWTNRDFSGGTVGIAWVGGACGSNRYNCIQDWTTNSNNLRQTVTHEVGHNLNSFHDAAGSPTIMAPAVNGSNTWSTNSLNVINNFINARLNTCFQACAAGAEPVADFSAEPTSGCRPLTVQFTDQSENVPTSWQWNFPGGTPSSSQLQNPQVVYNTAGTFNVTLTVTNALGSSQITKTNYITVQGPPVANFSFSLTGNAVQFVSTSTGNPTSFNWTFGDGNTSNEQNPLHVYSDDGVYLVTLEVESDCGTSLITKQVAVWTLPTAGFSALPTSGCAPMTVNFINESSSNAVNYSWVFQGGSPASSNAVNPTVTYNNPGVYNVTLTVSNPAGNNTVTKTGYIVVYSTPTANFTSTVSGRTVTFTNTSTNNQSNSWNFGDGNSSTDVNPVHTYAADGSYTVTLTVTNPCGSTTVTKTVVIDADPTAGFSGSPTSGCAPLTVQFTNSSTGPGSLTYNWSFPGGNPSTSSSQNPQVVYAAAGAYSVTLITSSQFGSDTLVRSNYVSVATTPIAGFTSVVNGLQVSFTNTSTNATTYLWDFGDGSTSNQANPVHTYSSGGTFTVILTATNSCGNNIFTATVNTAPSPTANFSGTPTSGCAGFSVNYTDQSTGTPTSWSWTFPGGTPASSTARNPQVTYNTPGTYSVTLTATNPSGSGNVTKTNYITVWGPVVAGFTQSIAGNTVTLTNTSAQATSYSWNFGDGNTSTAASPTHTYTNIGVYTITLTATGPCGNQTFSQQITIGQAPLAAFSGNPLSGCGPLTVNLTDQSTGVVGTRAWVLTGGSPATSSIANPTVVYNTPGQYSISLTVTNAVGSSSISKTNYVTVLPNPEANFNFSVAGTTVTFTNQSNNANTYSWNFGNGATSTDANPTYTYPTGGVYTVTLTVTGTCGSTSVAKTVSAYVAPVANFALNPGSGCAPQNVQFTDQSTNTPTSWSWSFPGGNPATSSAQNPSVSYSSPGVYTVTLTVQNPAGNNAVTKTDVITVYTVPTAGFTRNINANAVTFNNTSANATEYTWEFGDGITSSQANPTHTYAADGTYTVKLTAKSPCGTNVFTQSITILTAPVAAFTANKTEGCSPLTVAFDDNSSSNTTSWEWSFPGGTPATSSDQNPVVVYNTPGQYTVTLIAKNAAGSNVATKTNYITVNTIPQVAFVFLPDVNTVQFLNTTSGNNSYLWNFGDNTTSTETSPTHTYAQDGIYRVKLVAVNECGVDSLTKLVGIGEGAIPVAAMSFTPSEGCSPIKVNFKDLSTGEPSDWNWSFPGGTPATSTAQNPVVQYNNAGTYDITLIVFGPFGSDTLTLIDAITVGEKPTAAYTSTVTGASVDFSASTTNTSSYQWNFGDGATGSGIQTSHTYTASGTYSVQLIVTNECGSDTLTQTVQVTVVSATTPSWINQLEIFPNPNEGQFTVLLQTDPSISKVEFQITDLLGKVALRQSRQLAQGSVRELLNVDLPVGTYLLAIRSGKDVHYEKIIIQ